MPNPESIETIVARLSQKVDNLSGAFDDMKLDFKKMSEKLDGLLIEWQKFGGLYASVTDHNKRINDIEDCNNQFDIEYSDMLKEIKEERKDAKIKIKDYLWKIVAVGSLLGLLGTNLKDFIDLFK